MNLAPHCGFPGGPVQPRVAGAPGLRFGPACGLYFPSSGVNTRSNPACVYLALEAHILRTNIVIDDKLMRDTLRATGLKTKREGE